MRQWCLLVLISTLISGCGFRLRGTVELPPEFSSVWIQGVAANEPFYRRFKKSLNSAGGNLTSSPESAGIILNVLEDRLERRQLSLSDTGKAIEYELTYLLTYEMTYPDGEVIAPAQTIQIVKDYFNQQINVIGKSQEENVIREEIYRESVASLFRRARIVLRNK